MDMRKFKKLHEDEHTATLVHPDGHQFKVAKKALKGKLKDSLAAIPMAEGGLVEKIKSWASPAPTPMQDREHKPKVEMDKDKAKEVSDSFKSAFACGGEVQKFAEGTPEEPVQPVQQELPTMSLGDMPSASNQAQMQQPAVPQEQPSLTNVQIQPQQQQSQAAALMKPMDYTQQMVKGIEEQKAGIAGEAQAISQQGQAEAQAAMGQEQAMQAMQKHYEEESAKIAGERQKVIQDLKDGHIDPNHFMNSMGAGQKVATAIGLILGGIGAGTGENPVMKFLSTQIEHDIDAQKMEMVRKQNVLGALKDQMGNLQDATQMFRVLKVDQYKTQLEKAASQAKDPAAKARAQQAIGQLDQTTAPIIAQLGMRQAVVQGMGKGSITPEQAIQYSPLVPESQKAEAFKELDKVRAIDKSMEHITGAMKHVAELQTIGSRVMSPIQSRSKIEALNTAITSAARELYGKVSDTEIEQLGSLNIGLTDNQQTVQNKINAVQSMLMKNRNSSLLDSFGLLPKPPAMSLQKNTNVLKGK